MLDCAILAFSNNVLFHVLFTLAAIILLGRLLSLILAYLGQPPVMGEVLAGFVLGPSVVGRLVPGITDFMLPASAAPSLALIGQLGIMLYLFAIGLELDTELLRKRAYETVAISYASIIVPFLLGAALAVAMYRTHATEGVPLHTFALFFGVSMSVTAFPVLARILQDWNLMGTKLGSIAIGCAAMDDVTAWCLLAVVVSIAKSTGTSAIMTVALALAYTLVMLAMARPVARQFFERWRNGQELPHWVSTCAVGAVLASALITEWIGIHALFGAFLIGTVLPHDHKPVQKLGQGLRKTASVLLLPAFFAFSGMRTELGLLDGAAEWGWCLTIIVIATAGKFGGTLAAARWVGIHWREAAALGVLLNTRGLMELVVLNIGLDLGVISPTVFTMLVMMALVTTVATTPVLRWMGFYSREPVVHPPGAAGCVAV